MYELPPGFGEMMSPIDAAYQQYGHQDAQQPDAFYLQQIAAAKRAAILAQLQQSVAPLTAGGQVGFQGQFLGGRPMAPVPSRPAGAGTQARLQAIMAALAGAAGGWSQVHPDPRAGYRQVRRDPRAGYRQVRPRANAGYRQVHPRSPWTLVS